MLKADTSLTGWCSWYCCYEKVSEKDIAENLERLKLMPGFDYVLIDDGYQTHMGDWLRFSDKFPCGLPNVIKKIHEAEKKRQYGWHRLFAQVNRHYLKNTQNF